MAITDAGKGVLQYWAAISSAVEARASTEAVVAKIREVEGIPDGPIPGFTLTGLNEIRHAAVQVRTAEETFGAALADSRSTGVSRGIDSSMMAVAPWARGDQVLQAMATYQVQFEVRTVNALGERESTWLTAMYPGGIMPATTGELVDALGTFGNLSGSLPQGDFDSIGNVRIMAV
jgi:hypothetical protein